MNRKYRRFLSLVIAFVMSFSVSSVSINSYAATAGTAKITDADSAFNFETKIDGYKIIIKAEAGVFKAGTKVKVEAETEAREKEIKDIIKGAEGVNAEAALAESFKIRFIYNGKDVEPKDGGVEITIVPTKSFMKTANIEVRNAKTRAEVAGTEPVNADGKELSSKDVIQVFQVNGDKATAIGSTVKNSGITVKPTKNATFVVSVIDPVVLNTTAEEKAAKLAKAREIAARPTITFDKKFVQEYDDYIATTSTKGEGFALRWVLGETGKLVMEQEIICQATTIKIDKASYPVITAPDRRYGIYSNKTLDLGGATLTRSSGKNLLGTGDNPKEDTKSSGFDYYKKIKVCNGTIDGGTFSDGLFRFARVTGLTFENLTFKNIGQHAIEIAAVKDVVISNCVFEKPNYKPSSKSSGYEVLSLDMTSNDKNFPGYGKKDYLTCDGVKITGCTFKGTFRGLGSHHFKNTHFYENIEVTNNKFIDITDTAIEGCGWKNCTISGNTFDGVGYGVDFRQPTKLIDGGKYESYTCNNTISDNTFVLHKAGSKKTNVAIRTGGFELSKKSSNGVPKGKYYVDGYKITNNTISGESTDGISLEYTRKTTVSGNKISESGGNCIQFVASSDCKAIKNDVENSEENGIYIKGSKKITIDECIVNNAEKNSIHINKGSSNITVKNCTITGGNYGVSAIDATKKVTITGNTIKNSKMYGIKVTDRTTAKKINDNTISKTKKHGIYISNNATADKVCDNTISKVGKKCYGIYISNQSKAKKATGNTFPGINKKYTTYGVEKKKKKK